MNINIGGFFFYYFVCIYFINFVKLILSFPGGHSGKEPTSQCRRYNDSWVRKIPLEKEMATHSNVLALRIPGTGEPDGLPSMGSHRVGHDWSDLAVSKITVYGDCSHEIKRCLLLGRKVMTNLDSILKSREIILPTKVCLVKAVVFSVVMYGCESWTIKKAEHWRTDAFQL